MCLKRHSSSIRTPVKILHKVLHILTTIVVTGVVIRQTVSFVNDVLELADFINTPNWNRPAFYNNDDEDDDEEYTIAITPVLLTVEPDNSLNDYSSSDDDSLYSEDINYIDALLDSELVSLEEVKDFEDGEIDIDILLTIKDDILHEKLLNINLLIAKIEALKDNPTPSSDFMTKPPSISPNFFLEETNIFYNSLPDTETFCLNLEEKK
ncbi:hypothetical protein Tco_1305062 [Tanacetum coccineum]